MKNKSLNIHLIAGARPNFMKIAPLYKTMKTTPQINPVFIHTGQHYDNKMSGSFLEHLGLPAPDHYLEVGSSTHAKQTATIMIRYEQVLLEDKPDLVLVVGDVNSTVACALVASKLHVPIAHVEAGLRSHDREMPEEINRLLTDQISDFLFTSCEDAEPNLIKEGVSKDKIHFTGNLMIESLMNHQTYINQSTIHDQSSLKNDPYVLITMHRPSNVDHSEKLKGFIKIFQKLSQQIKIIFPAHPRTKNRIAEFGFDLSSNHSNLLITDPIDYFDFLALQKNAALVITDSGGVQEETTYFQVPCLTVRENTERPITCTEGTNELIGTDTNKILQASQKILAGDKKPGQIPRYWDDQVSKRIVDVIVKNFKNVCF